MPIVVSRIGCTVSLRRYVAAIVGVVVFATSSRAEADSPRFESDIQPFLVTHCYECHGRTNSRAGVDLRSVDFMTKPRDGYSPVVIGGQPKKSRLLKAIETGFMPPGGEVSAERVELIRSWIAADCPADSPAAVYGATLFKNWWILICGWAVLNLLAVGILWREAIPLGPLIVVLGAIPVLVLKASTAYWYPTDWCTAAGVVVMVVAAAAGGAVISAGNQRSLAVGAAWGLLAPIGLFLLAREKDAAT
jgi:hypothetical protein